MKKTKAESLAGVHTHTHTSTLKEDYEKLVSYILHLVYIFRIITSSILNKKSKDIKLYTFLFIYSIHQNNFKEEKIWQK